MFWHESFALWLIHAALASLVVLTVGSAAVLLWRQPARRLWMIELSLVGCLIAPWLVLLPGYPRLPIGWPVDQLLRLGPSPSDGAPSAAGRLIGNTSRSVDALRVTGASAGVWRVGTWLVAAYLCGVVLGILWWLLGMAALARLVRTARPASSHCRRLLAEIAGPQADRVRLLTSDRAKQPFAAPWWPAVIVLPEGLDNDAASVRWALAHEWMHIERRDFRVWLAAGLARVLFFYQPLAWWLCGQLRLCQDYLADARAASLASQPEEYAAFLAVRAGSGTLPPAMVGLGMGFRKSELYRRVVMLVQNRAIESRPPRRWRIVATLVALVLIGLLPSLSLPPKSAAQEQEATVRKASTNKKMEFHMGPRSFPDGDEITIEELWSERRSLAENDTVRVKGTYMLRSRPYATLLFGATTARRGIPQQSPVTRLVRADYSVPFEMELSITTEGYLHVGLYDNETGGCFATVYFGTYLQMKEIAHWKVAGWMHQGRKAK